MSSAYGTLAPRASSTPLLLPELVTLKNGAQATLEEVDSTDSILIAQMRQFLNDEIAAGDTYPQELELDEAGFAAYFLSANAFVLKSTGSGDIPPGEPLGVFYIKPNFPGRCSHICNAGFIVSPKYRSRGVGTALAQSFLRLAPLLHYRAAMFNLVFTSNTSSIRIWDKLGFQRIGRLPRAGRLLQADGSETYTDAIMYYYDFCKDQN
ncbi:hypothetical protein DFS34DRAFT_412387 [Phlyctochytrium arcticum]|nr:hypothetical protein DFS34DRAFT_412387 [Phlyctochytrium arcticum]